MIFRGVGTSGFLIKMKNNYKYQNNHKRGIWWYRYFWEKVDFHKNIEFCKFGKKLKNFVFERIVLVWSF